MLARKPLPAEYRAWNRRWGAPYGSTSRYAREVHRRLPALARRYPAIRGPFAWQDNNDTRVFEYPWAFSVTPLESGMRALELGGSLSGFQFVLDREGLEVINVDPGLEAAGTGWPCDAASIARLNRAFKTSVDLRNTTLEHAGVPDASIDRVFSISVIEHIPENELPLLVSEIRRIITPGGFVVMTIDLFLDLAPFSAKTENRFGENVDVRRLVERFGFDMVVGDPAELLGYPEFDPQRIMGQLPDLYYGTGYPACIQLVVLRAPTT